MIIIYFCARKFTCKVMLKSIAFLTFALNTRWKFLWPLHQCLQNFCNSLWRNFENQSTFDCVMIKNHLSCFLIHCVWLFIHDCLAYACVVVFLLLLIVLLLLLYLCRWILITAVQHSCCYILYSVHTFMSILLFCFLHWVWRQCRWHCWGDSNSSIFSLIQMLCLPLAWACG